MFWPVLYIFLKLNLAFRNPCYLPSVIDTCFSFTLPSKKFNSTNKTASNDMDALPTSMDTFERGNRCVPARWDTYMFEYNIMQDNIEPLNSA